MRKLDRSAVPPPPCLASFQHGRHNWDHVEGHQKQEIRDHLEQMQGRFCAYCEGSLSELEQHIDHFLQKDKNPKLTFAWTNLLWSCLRDDSCGRFKDMCAGKYSPSDLLDPCLEDPDHYFRFRSDGTISLRPGLSAAEQRKARETLRILNLDPQFGRLRRMRQNAVAGFLSLLDECISQFSSAELQQLFADELTTAAQQPFFTTVRHVLTEP